MGSINSWDQLDQAVERVIDEAIDFYMETRGWYRGDNGSFVRMDEAGWEITPPGQPVRTAGGQVTFNGQPHEYAFDDYGSGTNAGSFVYGHFEETIRDIFQPWRSIPIPRNFDQYLNYLTDAAFDIALGSQGTGIDHTGNYQMDNVNYVQGKIRQGHGDMIETFDRKFSTHLPTVIHGQYDVIALVGNTLAGERQIWQYAEWDVYKIAENLEAAMKARGKADDLDLSTIASLATIASVFPTPGKTLLAGVGSILKEVDQLGGGSEPTKPTVKFAAGTPEGVITKTQEALKKLAETIKDREGEIEKNIKKAIGTITSHEHQDSFAMPKKNKTLSDTHPINGMQMNLTDLHTVATEALPDIEKQLNKASDNLWHAFDAKDSWFRPVNLGVSNTPYGPVGAWQALASLAEELVADLAWQVKASGGTSGDGGRTDRPD